VEPRSGERACSALLSHPCGLLLCQWGCGVHNAKDVQESTCPATGAALGVFADTRRPHERGGVLNAAVSLHSIDKFVRRMRPSVIESILHTRSTRGAGPWGGNCPNPNWL
jgi:hypothetical protein